MCTLRTKTLTKSKYDAVIEDITAMPLILANVPRAYPPQEQGADNRCFFPTLNDPVPR